MAESETVGQRFTQLIAHLGISKNAFAASLDKTATVIQHLVDERNKPGFDLLCKVFEVYPDVSKDWLLQGEGPMLVDGKVAPVQEARSAPAAKVAPATSVTTAQVPPVEPQDLKLKTVPQPVEAEAAPPAIQPAAERAPVANEPVPPVAVQPIPQPAVTSPAAAVTPAAATNNTSWQTALYTQQMAHQLAMAELRNQHLQEQQRLMQQMMELMQRQLAR